jgi:hypothetical protein
MASQEAERIHRKAVIVEGHRDIFEMFHLAKQGQHHPVLNVTVPRLRRANISTTFYAVCGDSLTHVRGTYRYLSSALENIDALRQEQRGAGMTQVVEAHVRKPGSTIANRRCAYIRWTRLLSNWYPLHRGLER